jgi:nucleotide-binding universal stress UspA family protein
MFVWFGRSAWEVWVADERGPLIIGYDGSECARYAIDRAAALFPGRRAVVVTVWQPVPMKWLGGGGSPIGVVPEMGIPELHNAVQESAAQLAREGASLANKAGLYAESLPLEAAEAVWAAIVEIADSRDAAAIVVGSRGHTGLRAVLLGSVSNAIVHRSARPTLIVHRPATEPDGSG